ncbi:MAG: MFS transporter [Thermoanaerobaculum sp.]|nr:MFS transporter [Thermoanaerobaculum sp.]MDW7968158.1 MFS transporter [Thermoanaerobaculum sp.]
MLHLTRAQLAWCLYDWANSAFVLVCMTALLPPLLVAAANGELGSPAGTVAWGWFSTAGLAASVAVSPLLGAWADTRAARLPALAALVLVGAGCCLVLGLCLEESWLLAGLVYVLAATAFSLANVVYDALLPGVAAPHELHRVSSWAYSLGYLGGGIALVLALLLYRLGWVWGSFALVGAWWACFSWPVLRGVSEPPPNPRGAVWRTLAESWKAIRLHPQAFRFLVAYWLYNDGIGTVIKMAGAYAGDLGIPLVHVVGALLLAQWVGVPATLAFAGAARRWGAKPLILFALGVYLGVGFWGLRLSQPWEFWALAGIVGLVQGGAQALSRSFFARFVPLGSEATFFAFFDVSARLAGVLGPAFFALATQAYATSRAGVAVTAVFFLAGGVLLATVKEPRFAVDPSESTP